MDLHGETITLWKKKTQCQLHFLWNKDSEIYTFVSSELACFCSVLGVPFHMKRKQELAEDKTDVKNLGEWKPAPLLLQSIHSLSTAENGRSLTQSRGHLQEIKTQRC